MRIAVLPQRDVAQPFDAGASPFLPLPEFAFGLRFSLFDRTCPLAIVVPFVARFVTHFVTLGVGGGARGDAALDPLQQVGAIVPVFGASLKRPAHLDVGHLGGAVAVGLRQRAAAVRGVLGLAALRYHARAAVRLRAIMLQLDRGN
ncbi:MAG: hypothetical protein ACJ8FF_02155 [Sphingomicrobium sp.]